MEHERSFTAKQIREAIDGDPPSDRMIRNTLEAMEGLGLLASEGGSGRDPLRFFPDNYESTTEVGGYSPRSVSGATTIPYPGGKRGVADWILNQMPAHDTFVEVFGGAAGLLVEKPRSKYEVYNDQNEDLTHFFSVLRERPDELAEWLQFVPYSREVYERWVDEFYSGYRSEDSIERAGRFFSLRYMQFVGEASSPNGFKTRARRSPARTFDNARNRLTKLADRFSQVIVENEDYTTILKNYDDSRADVLFYCDPPYIGSEGYYGVEFDHHAFVNSLHEVDNDWIVSYDQVPEGLEKYTHLHRESRHRMTRGGSDVTETLVINFEPEERERFADKV